MLKYVSEPGYVLASQTYLELETIYIRNKSDNPYINIISLVLSLKNYIYLQALRSCTVSNHFYNVSNSLFFAVSVAIGDRQLTQYLRGHISIYVSHADLRQRSLRRIVCTDKTMSKLLIVNQKFRTGHLFVYLPCARERRICLEISFALQISSYTNWRNITVYTYLTSISVIRLTHEQTNDSQHGFTTSINLFTNSSTNFWNNHGGVQRQNPGS